jgi:hypothetical protein
MKREKYEFGMAVHVINIDVLNNILSVATAKQDKYSSLIEFYEALQSNSHLTIEEIMDNNNGLQTYCSIYPFTHLSTHYTVQKNLYKSEMIVANKLIDLFGDCDIEYMINLAKNSQCPSEIFNTALFHNPVAMLTSSMFYYSSLPYPMFIGINSIGFRFLFQFKKETFHNMKNNSIPLFNFLSNTADDEDYLWKDISNLMVVNKSALSLIVEKLSKRKLSNYDEFLLAELTNCLFNDNLLLIFDLKAFFYN